MRRELKGSDVSVERLRSQILDASPDLILIKDRESRILWANRAVCELMGVPLERLRGLRDEDFPQNRANAGRYRADDEKVFAQESPVIIPEEPVVGRDGRVRWYHTVKTPVRDASGAPRLLVAVCRDITSPRAARVIIDRLAQCFLSFGTSPLDNISRLTALCGELLDADCAVYNRAERGILSAVGRWRVPEGFNPVNASQGTLCGEVVARAADEPLVVCGLDSGPFTDAKCHSYAGIAVRRGSRVLGSLCVYFRRDIVPDSTLTRAMAIVASAVAVEEERLREEKERARLSEELRQAQKLEAIGRLSGGIAHDFNNILTSIMGYAEMLAAGAADEEARCDALAIVKSADSAAALTRQLLAFGRRQLLVPRVMDLNSVMARTASMLKRLIGEDIRLTVSPWPVEARVRADSNQLEQVLLNLALNARDAMPDGGSLEISLAESRTPLPAAVGLPALGEHWTLTVRDTGVGISPEILAHIFEPFFTTKELGKGTGLGLATAYGAVAQSGGRITCESAPGKGTAFHVRLPKTDAPLDPEAAPGALDRGSGKILVVEDDPAIREMFTRALRATGYEVLAAPDAESALLLAEQSGADIRALVTDVVMPGINGRQLAMRLEAERPDLKVVYMSGYTDDAAFRDALRPGTAFLQKPFNASELCRKLKEVLGA